jgi:crotonobetainyl-CoA:carnitine CoA-transferase CaiB-like acyl-CoA transferase
MDLEVAPGVRGPVAAGFFEFDEQRQHPKEKVGETWSPRANPTNDPPEPSLPFAGLRVLDFGIGGVGVEAGRLFAEYGAEVIKIETRVYPDFIRIILGSEMNPSFASSSRSKQSFGVNAKDPAGLEVLLRLIEQSDVLIENGSTGTMDSLGIGFDVVHSLNPRAVMVNSQLLGSHGRWADWIGYGPSTQPIGGLVHLWNYDDQDFPAGSGAIFPDHLAGRICALGASAALIARQSANGTGCRVEVAQVEAVTGMLGDLLLKAGLEPGSVVAQGNRRDDGAPWGAYPCAGEQQWCVITVRDDEEWRRLVDALGAPTWAQSPELKTAEGRRSRHDDIDEHLSEWTRQRSKREVEATLQDHAVACGAVLTGTDLLNDPHLIDRGYQVPIIQQDLGPITLEGPCFRATGMSPPIETQAPRLGEHTRQICLYLLGMGDDDIDALVSSGALEVPLPEAD